MNDTADVMDYEEHWGASAATYGYQPTVRHRQRFVLNSLKGYSFQRESFVFDYGCGMGACLQAIKQRFGLRDDQLGACDLAARAIETTREKLPGAHLIVGDYPELSRPCDVVVCSEVIEHTDEYEQILRWIFDNLTQGGLLVLSTPGGVLDAPNKFYGHIQHFELAALRTLLETIGYEVSYAKCWGFPLYSLQKYVTNRYFGHVRKAYMESVLTLRKKLIYNAAYSAYFLHDWINGGPQIYIRAGKPGVLRRSGEAGS